MMANVTEELLKPPRIATLLRPVAPDDRNFQLLLLKYKLTTWPTALTLIEYYGYCFENGQGTKICVSRSELRANWTVRLATDEEAVKLLLGGVVDERPHVWIAQ
jgi:hypothetical protein